MNKCVCEILRTLDKGRVVTIQVDGTSFTLTFLGIEGDCASFKLDSTSIQFDCKKITSIQCENPLCIPTIVLNNPGPLSCEGFISGRVICNGIGLGGVIVTLSSNPGIINFTNPVLITNALGEFSTTLTIPVGTQPQNVTITASISVNYVQISNSIIVNAGCVACSVPELTLNVPESINCEGEITGTLTCDDIGVPNTLVFFTINSPSGDVTIFPNPVETEANGTFSTNIISQPGVLETVVISATATVGNQVVNAGPFNVDVNCPEIPVPCPCKFMLNTAGNSQPGAQITVTENGIVQNLTGTMNMTVLECGASPNQPCNPALDNFNFTFNASNGNTYQFTQGRRTTISCNMNTATVIGTIKGNINNGPPITFMATVTGTLNEATDEITWTINATSGTISFVTTVPFTAEATPQSFIGSCP